MRTIFLLLTLLSLSALISCKEEVNGYDDLNPDQQQWVRDQAAIQCVTSSTSIYNRFKSQSAEQFNPAKSTFFVRENTWKIEHKKAAELWATSKIIVWKVVGNVVYFLWEDDRSGNKKFLKIDLATNDEMIDNLKSKKCTKDLVISEASDFLRINTTATTTPVSGTKIKEDNTYKLDFRYLAFFGLLFNEKNTKKTYNSSNVVTETVERTNILSTTTTTNLPANYATYAGAEFCVVVEAPADAYAFPYLLRCSPDEIAGPTGWAGPGAELAI